MTKLYYCETHYNIKPPMDINPLLLRLYKNNKMLVICTREGMKTRIEKFKRSDEYHGPEELSVCGIWELEKAGLIEEGVFIKDIFETYDAIVIIGRERAHDSYKPLLRMIENVLC